jgi:hypothetical protein
MLEKVIVRIIYNTSRVVFGIGMLSIIGPFLLFIILCLGQDTNPKSALKIYGWYSDIMGSYGFIKVLVTTVIALIFISSTEPFVEEKNSKEEKNKEL